MGATFIDGERRRCAAEPKANPRVPDAVEFARARLGFDPDERQCEVLLSEAKRGILLCTRQWGKSTVAAAKAVYRAYTRPGSLVLVASPSFRQSAELLDDKAAPMVARLGIRPRGDGHNAASLLFPNGSRIVGIPAMESTTRGFSAASLILIDEASRVPDAMYKALRPMLAVSRGDLWMMSTPNGKKGFFYENWEYDTREKWFRVRATALECPRISPEYVKDERNQHGDEWVRQEYMTEFVDNGTTVFSRELIEAALDDDLEPV